MILLKERVGEGQGRKKFQGRAWQREGKVKKKKDEKRLKFPTVLIKILLHTFLPQVPLDCPWSFLLIHKISHQWLRLMISGADKHKSWWNIAAAPIRSLRVKTQTSRENSSFNWDLGSPAGWGSRRRALVSAAAPATPLSPLFRHQWHQQIFLNPSLGLWEMPAWDRMSFNLRKTESQALASSSWEVSPGSSAPGLAGVMAYVWWWQHTQEPGGSHTSPRFL